MITSADNSKIKQIASFMKKKKAREEAQVFVCEGKKLCYEVLTQYPDRLRALYLSESAYAALGEAEQAALAGHTVDIISDGLFAKLAETVTPQGVLAVVAMPESVRGLSERAKERVLFLENLQDPGNLGTIIRTAEAAGVTGILLSKDSVDAFSPKVVRATMGAILRVPIAYAEDFYKALSAWRQDGRSLYAAHLQGSVPYDDVSYGERFGVLIGNEANGLSEQAASLAIDRIRIPMCGQVESLNAGIATAVILYEALRQRRRKTVG